MQAPDYTLSDLAFYGGLMTGFIISYLMIQSIFPDWPYLARLAIGAVFGIGTGFSTLKLYESRLKPPTNTDDSDHRSYPES